MFEKLKDLLERPMEPEDLIVGIFWFICFMLIADWFFDRKDSFLGQMFDIKKKDKNK